MLDEQNTHVRLEGAGQRIAALDAIRAQFEGSFTPGAVDNVMMLGGIEVGDGISGSFGEQSSQLHE